MSLVTTAMPRRGRFEEWRRHIALACRQKVDFVMRRLRAVAWRYLDLETEIETLDW
jgi:hypothetical protein